MATETLVEAKIVKKIPKKPPRPSLIVKTRLVLNQIESKSRKNCTYCKCPRENHDIETNVDISSGVNGIQFKIGGLKLDDNNGFGSDEYLPPPPPPLTIYQDEGDDFPDVPAIENDAQSSFPAPPIITNGNKSTKTYLWAPPGLNSSQVEEYFKEIPSEKVPIPGTPGMKYYDEQCTFQNPPQDRAKMANVSPEKRDGIAQFWKKEEQTKGYGVVKLPFGSKQRCFRCSRPILRSEPAVIAEDIGKEAVYHPACFSCETCDELLVNLIYYRSDDEVYCARHHAELTKQRCGGCDELIFSGEYTVAMNRSWHLGHFRCQRCDSSITGKQFIVLKDKPVCNDCFKDSYAHECHACGQKIGPESRDISSDDKRHWHDYCFKCDLCHRPLQSDGKFTFYKDKTLCTTCYATNYQKACKACNKPIDSGGSRLEYNGNYFHEHCFVCKICSKEIGTSGFVPKDDEFYCPSCFQNEFSKRCAGCGEPLLEGGVLYGGQTWHKTCFTCHYCHRSLAANAFSVRDGFRYCMECYGTFYAKQCEICMKPIVGGEYYTLDESNFHKDCFMCSRCSRSLASEGFVREGMELLCANCAD
ncbi:testin-like isoform X2 [Actinia tenebrosa]|uniref:Testin-like isoform X2 n=1 Tax=Actinia tenebrosa TaxID=6105 RepID=A0A6P8HUE6_ACTTE|nr:testin-like isoform X2 [Actinia tenebrosa]